MASSEAPPKNWLHPGYSHQVLREWQEEGSRISPVNLIYPIFVSDEPDKKEEITSLPEQYRLGVNRLPEVLDPLVAKGLRAVLIFGVLTSEADGAAAQCKEETGAIALRDDSPVVLSLQFLQSRYPSLLLIADVCLCAYTSHGHCGLLTSDGYINNAESIKRIGEVAVHYARAGAHVVAPSDMMDGRVKEIKKQLYENALANRCAVMSYSAKYCSAFYGPFRDACHSAPKEDGATVFCAMSDRSMYQLPPGSRNLGLQATKRCMEEGADFVMVKPGGPYMDMIRDVKNIANVPVAVYQVSGEYALLWHGAQNGAVDLKSAVLEWLRGFRRAGADLIITYYTPRVLYWLSESPL